ncbi:MAG: hypothetical protein ABIZ81_16090 [Opitutaceae bacterium]
MAATRLLSFLTDVEQALIKEAAANLGPSWITSRMINYHHGVARMTLTPATDVDSSQLRGSVFLQGFELADGSLCVKASLNWQGSDAFPVIAVYAKPSVDWRAEAAKIASAWLAGPPVAVVTTAAGELSPLVAAAG